jgi:type II secretory pathway component PulF
MILYKFKYVAISENGSKLEGIKFASNVGEIKSDLKNKKFTDIRVQKILNSIDDVKFKKSNLNYEELSYLFGEMHDLIKLGNNISDSILFIKSSTTMKEIKSLLTEIYTEILAGSKLSSSLINSGRIDSFSNTIIKVAEETGNYDKALESLSEYYKDKAEISGKIKSSLIKPIILMIALTLASLFLITTVIPKIGDLFVGTPIQPPFTTQVLLSIDHALINYSYLIFISIVAVVSGVVWFFKNEKTSKYKMKLPVIGKMRKMSFQAEFLMSYYLLLNHGVQTTKAIEIIKENTTDTLYINFLNKISNSLVGGQQLSSIILSNDQFFDPIIGHMFKKGEITGTSNEVAGKLYENYKVKTKKYLEHFPLILDTLSLAVGGSILIFIFSGIIYPVISFIQNMGKL